MKAGLLPEPSPAALDAMVADFKDRHRTGKINHQSLREFAGRCKAIGGNYCRFSCDNSEPKSIIDQMVESLEKAREEEHFIPWAYVHADYSVSGLDSERLGYNAYKDAMSAKDTLIKTTYIADFTRASRDEIEWWKLAALSKKLNKGLVGAEDGFRLDDPDWEMKLTLYGLLSRMFIKSLRQKVLRGMRSAAKKGASLGKPPLGFTRQVMRNEDGNVVVGTDGDPKMVPCIDPETKGIVIEMFDLFVNRGWTSYRIMKEFNKQQMEGWNGWTEGGIRKILYNPAYMGVFIWNRTRKEFDWEEEKWVIVENPRSLWNIHYDPKLAFVPRELWKGARRLLAASRAKNPNTGKHHPKRTATTLFSNTLVCGYCGRPVILWKKGQYPVMYCPNGHNGQHGCELSVSKSTRIIEECLLAFIKENLFTEEVMHDLFKRANEFLAGECRKPNRDVALVKNQIAVLESKISKLVRKIEDEDDDSLSHGYHTRVKQLQGDLNDLRRDVREAEAANVAPPPPLDIKAISGYLTDLRGILTQDVPMAAEGLRALTGPITITQEKIPGKCRGGRWIATFSPNLIQLLAKIAKNKECPDCITLEYLSSRKWTGPSKMVVPIEKVPRYEVLAAEFRKRLEKGASVSALASDFNMSWKEAQQIVEFALHGQRPDYGGRKPAKRKLEKASSKLPKYKLIADDVVRMKDEDRVSFTKIRDWLKERRGISVHYGTVVDGYEHGRRQRGLPIAPEEAP